MVQKQEEVNGCGLNGDKVGGGSPQEKGRKNKRKLADPTQLNTASLTEFPRYELHALKAEEVSNTLKVEDSESVEWDDPFACHLEELLTSNLLTIFLNAMKQVIDCGYTDDDVLKAISGSRLYCGGNDLVSNIVNNALNVLKNGNKATDSRDHVFEDLQQLVGYTLVEMISLVKEIRPSLSTVEAMWLLLMCDLNVLQAFEVESPESPTFGSSKSSESHGPECNPPVSSEPDNPKSTRSSGKASGKEVPSCKHVSGEGVKSSSSFTLVSDEKLLSCRKGRTKKEIAMLRQKSCMEKVRSYGKGSGYKSARYSAVGNFLLEKRTKSSHDIARNCPSKITAEIGVKVSLEESSFVHKNSSSKGDSPMLVVDAKGYITALPATSATSAPKKKSGSETAALVPPTSEKKSGSSVPSASERKSGSESEEKVSVSAKLPPDYYAGIPYDASLGVYVPRDKKDELVLKLAPRVNDLQNELQVWTDWANQKVKEATVRLLKDQPELKVLRKEREEALQHKKEKKLLEENTMKRLSEMELAVKNTTSQFEKANNAVRRLEVEQSLLKKEMESAKLRAAESAESCREAKERGQRSLKDTQSWEGQKVLLQEELKSQRDKVTLLQKEVTKAKNRQNQTEATWKQERTANAKLAAQASAIKKERKELEAQGKAEEERIKRKAETDSQYYTENNRKLEREISELKLKSDYSRIAALKKSGDDSRGTTAAAAEREDLVGETRVKRERECVMCLCEEMSVIFLPCAHQVLCSKCNQLHEKQGMMDCPSCRGTIQKRIQARFARAG